jgi:hypothetical protein
MLSARTERPLAHRAKGLIADSLFRPLVHVAMAPGKRALFEEKMLLVHAEAEVMIWVQSTHIAHRAISHSNNSIQVSASITPCKTDLRQSRAVSKILVDVYPRYNVRRVLLLTPAFATPIKVRREITAAVMCMMNCLEYLRLSRSVGVGKMFNSIVSTVLSQTIISRKWGRRATLYREDNGLCLTNALIVVWSAFIQRHCCCCAGHRWSKNVTLTHQCLLHITSIGSQYAYA